MSGHIRHNLQVPSLINTKYDLYLFLVFRLVWFVIYAYFEHKGQGFSHVFFVIYEGTLGVRKSRAVVFDPSYHAS